MNRIDLIIGEGPTEIAVAHHLLDLAGIDRTGARSIPKGGQNGFWAAMPGYLKAASNGLGVFALADLEQETCAPLLLAKKLPVRRPSTFCLRLAVRMSEAWLLADTSAVADWLRISQSLIPDQPDALPHAKRSLINLARRSPKSRLRAALVPEPGYSSVVGAEYLPEIESFIATRWSPSRAATRSDSLRRALLALGV